LRNLNFYFRILNVKFISRTIQKVIREAARGFPAMVLTGPRRTGKSTLLRHMFPHARYVLLEDPDVQSRARSDPRALLDELRPPVIFDGIHNVPQLSRYIRTRIDENPSQTGTWVLAGLREVPSMQTVIESMPGRAAILQLLSFSLAETDRVNLLHGGYPEVIARPTTRELMVQLLHSNLSGARRPRHDQHSRSGNLPALPRHAGQPSRPDPE
jgi:predicted AAA+ superfamily ATPase